MYEKMHQTVFAFSKFRGHSQKLSKPILEFNLPKTPLTTCFFLLITLGIFQLSNLCKYSVEGQITTKYMIPRVTPKKCNFYYP